MTRSKSTRTTLRLKRGYRQHCALAKALDVIGDRWTLLIVRELLLRAPCRYTDVRNGLPGIATNLLAARLRDLAQSGIIRREEAPPPVAATLLHLTPRGEGLRAVVHAIGRWGGALLGERAAGDSFCSHWLAMPAELLLADRTPGAEPIAIELRSGDEPVVVETVNGAIHTRIGRAERPDLVLSGAPHLVLGVLAGRVPVAEARKRGLRCEGNLKTLRRVQPGAR